MTAPGNLSDATSAQVAAAVRRALARTSGVPAESQVAEIMNVVAPVLAAKDAARRRAVASSGHAGPAGEQTHVTTYGGIYVAPPDAATVLGALTDAAECAEEHQPDQVSLAWAGRYRQFRQRLEATR